MISYGQQLGGCSGKAFQLRVKAGDSLVFSTCATEYVSPVILQPNTWHHVAVTYNAGIMKFYKNGVLTTPTTSVTLNTGAPTDCFAFGKACDQIGVTYYAEMIYMDEIKLWNREITLVILFCIKIC